MSAVDRAKRVDQQTPTFKRLEPELDSVTSDMEARTGLVDWPSIHRPLDLPEPMSALRRVWLVGAGLFGLQFIALVLWSWHLWTRFALTNDMATFGQAFSQIGTGHLNPYETTFPYYYPHWGYPFYQSHFEVLMWPLALLYTLTHSLFTLLVVQDLALAAAGAGALRWGIDVLESRWPTRRRGASIVAAGLILLLLVNPWTYWAASFDFHFQTIAACFAVLAGLDAWNGRKRAWIWIVLVLACGDVAATYAIAVGLIAIVTTRKSRWMGLEFIGASVVWLMLITLVHSGKGSDLSGGYGYLAGHPVREGLPGVLAILAGVVTHPSRPLSVLRGRWHPIYQYLAGSGLIGVGSAVGLIPVLVVLLANGLNSSPIYVTHLAAFQNVLIVFFMGVGAVAVLVWLSRRSWRGAMVLVTAIGLAALVQACVVSVHVTPQSRTMFAAVSAPTSAELARVEGQVPASDEAVVSQGVIGRFGARQYVYPFGSPFVGGQSVPIHGHTIFFVFTPTAGVEIATPTATDHAVSDLRHLGARTIANSHGVIALVWHPPQHTTQFQLADQ